ncbi:MAG TPA: membrane protein insertion efficiency factor YidD [Candidatus Binataceae bacterium]|nr:membrane protein insertion efficiency factor YidD [Candidatus Binataceae bacterium]
MSAAASMRELPRHAASGVLRLYKVTLSPLLAALFGPACRFEPTCSEYAAQAIAHRGLIRGGAMALVRFARCNPLGGHGHDPVPRQS